MAEAGAGQSLDLLVNNAPAFPVTPAMELSVSEFSAALDGSLHGAFSASREAVRSAQAADRRLTIVNVVSVSAVIGVTGRIVEASVSAAVLAMTHALAAEWGPVGVRVAAVMVGPTDAWTVDGGASSDRDPMAGIDGVFPLGRTVTDEDVATAVANLASPESAAQTGQAVVVDAGWLADGWRRA